MPQTLALAPRTHAPQPKQPPPLLLSLSPNLSLPRRSSLLSLFSLSDAIPRAPQATRDPRALRIPAAGPTPWTTTAAERVPSDAACATAPKPTVSSRPAQRRGCRALHAPDWWNCRPFLVLMEIDSTVSSSPHSSSPLRAVTAAPLTASWMTPVTSPLPSLSL
jgi:hypothetical protein